jgi:nucleotide-binding universal stress UspA family protein
MSGIIVGVDGSGHSRRALEWGMNEAAIRQVPLTVITVTQVIVSYWGAMHYQQDQAIADKAGQAMAAEVDELRAKLGDAGPASVTVRTATGVPAEEILNAARDADMIVVGSRGVGGFPRLYLGSVSTQLTHHAPCPVVVIPPEDRG